MGKVIGFAFFPCSGMLQFPPLPLYLYNEYLAISAILQTKRSCMNPALLQRWKVGVWVILALRSFPLNISEGALGQAAVNGDLGDR